MIVVELTIALILAKYGGGVLVSYDDGHEHVLGWIFLLAGVAVAAFAGRHL